VAIPSFLASIVSVVTVVAALYLGRDFLIPVALAVLLGFWLSPVVGRVERVGLPRVASVLLVTTFVGVLLLGGGWLAGSQLAELPPQLPVYRENLLQKVRAMRGPLGALERAGRVLDEVEHELDRGQRRASTTVEVVERPSPLAAVSALVGPLVAPLATAAAVAVLVIFLLLQREDLRDRLLAILGQRDLTATTDAIDDATARLSRYLGAQSLLCAAHGVLVGLGLFAIGIPGAWLWGLAAGLLRFIPYLGPWLAAAFPIAVSIAAFPGWSPAMATIALFVFLELLSNNVLEPWLYGTTVGLTPFAVVLSALFWTWLWGLPGLFLATPLTVCVVVAGRFLEPLAFLRTLLGDEAPLEPVSRLYQRLLCLDVAEARKILRDAIDDGGLSAASDRVVWPALRWLQHEVDRGALELAKTQEMDDVLSGALVSQERRQPVAGLRPIRLVSGSEPGDRLACTWIAHVLASSGLDVADGASPALDGNAVVCLLASSARGIRAALETLGSEPAVALCIDPRIEAIVREAPRAPSPVVVARTTGDLVRRLHSLARRPSPLRARAARDPQEAA